MGFGALAGCCYWHWQNRPMSFAGFLLMVGWHVMDGLDGKLARASGKASPLGRLIDGLCDYIIFFLVLLPIVLHFADWQPALALAIVSGLCHAAAIGLVRRRARSLEAPGARRFRHRSAAAIGAFRGEAALQPCRTARWAAVPRAIDAALAAHPVGLDAYLDATAPHLRRLSILSANNRTIAIAMACLAGNPRLYWYWEIVALSLIALAMAVLLRRREAEVVAGFGAMPPALPVTPPLAG